MSDSNDVNQGAKLANRKPHLKLIAEGVKAVEAPGVPQNPASGS